MGLVDSILTDPGVVKFFELLLAVLKVLNQGVLERQIICENTSVSFRHFPLK